MNEILSKLIAFITVVVPIFSIMIYLMWRAMDDDRYNKVKAELQVKWPKYWRCMKCSFITETKIGTVCERCGISDWKALSDYEIGVFEDGTMDQNE